MELTVEVPPRFLPERKYVLDVLLGEFLGLPYHLEIVERDEVRIKQRDDPSGRMLVVVDSLFALPEKQWLTPQSLPLRPLVSWNQIPFRSLITSASLPLLYGRKLPNGSYSEATANNVRLGADIFGSCFFLLTRYEELVNRTRDGHERMTASSSLASLEGFLDRPLVNEYLELLWSAMKMLWPDMRRRPRAFRVLLSHDVDWPLGAAGRRLAGVSRLIAGDLVRRRSASLAARRLVSYLKGLGGNLSADLCNTFDFIMDLSERHGFKSAFYFIAGHTAGEIDGVYSMSDPWIRDLMRRIHRRGHEVGLHPSYNTFRDSALLSSELKVLRDAARDEGIEQSEWGGRQHILRWEAPTTWQAWEEAGLHYDSTLTFADRVGFRCGTCYEYPVFNLLTHQPLRLRERPLLVMDVSLRAARYMNLPPGEALRVMNDLLARCRMFDGDFTLLWHNNQLVTPEDVELYRGIVQKCAEAHSVPKSAQQATDK